METQLVLDEITDKVRNEMGRLDRALVAVGRDPGGDGLALPSGSISRVHAHFVRHRNAWFFVDNGSTNGSWVNGVKVVAGQYRVVRPGTVLQLADKAFQLSVYDENGKKTQRNLWSLGGDENAGGRSVFYFRANQFEGEYPAPLYTRALRVGGSGTDLPLPEYEGKRPALVIEDRNNQMFAVSMSKEEPFMVNGKQCIDNVELADNDIIEFRDMLFVMNAPLDSLDPVMADETSAADILESVGLRSWNNGDDEEEVAVEEEGTGEVPTWRDENRPKAQVHGVFGAVPQEQEQDLGYDAMDMGQMQHHRSGSFPKVEPEKGGLDKLEDKLLLIVGLVMLLALVGIVGWWLVKMSS